jgi:hypothetical protein
VDGLGSVGITIPATSNDRSLGFSSLLLIHEDIQQKLSAMMMFASWLLDEIDPVKRLTDVAISVAIFDASHLGWKTRQEFATSPGTMQPGHASGLVTVHLLPSVRKRASLLFDVHRHSEDLTVLLRREII